MNIQKYKRAGYPAVCVETFEDARLTEQLRAAFPEQDVYLIAASGGLRDLKKGSVADPLATFSVALKFIATRESAFLVMLDFQHVVTNAVAYRALLDALPGCKSRGTMVIMLAPSWTLPAELQHEIPILHEALPGPEALASALDVILEASKDAGHPRELDESGRAALLSAARGLTVNEAENAYALSACNGLQPATVEAEKMRLVKSRCMTVEQPQEAGALGGLGCLKTYITAEVLPSRDDDKLRVRGLLLVGVPGTGKSLAARVIAAMLNWPLVRLDLAAAKGSLVGESEATTRHALSTVDAVAPAVLWIDEVEKAVGGFASSASTDGGTTLGMVGTLLTWLQEHDSPVLVVATCNDYAKLPPEMVRAGRFDERFFLDLPGDNERSEIAAIHLGKLGCDQKYAVPVANLSEDFTGAEIEQLVKSAARRSRRNPTFEHLKAAAGEIIPISKGANIRELRSWAKDHLRRANDAEEAPRAGRRLA